MEQKSKAVICREINQPVVVEQIIIEPRRRGEVMIKLAACGVYATATSPPPTAPSLSHRRSYSATKEPAG
jgi:hypothetical protein